MRFRVSFLLGVGLGREWCLELSLDLSWLVGFWGFVWFLLGERSTSAPSRDALAAVGYVQTVPDARTAFAFLSAWFCWPRDRRLALGARMVFRAAPILSQPRFEHGTASGCCASSDVDALAVGEQLVQLFLGDCARRGWRERSLRRGRSASDSREILGGPRVLSMPETTRSGEPHT